MTITNSTIATLLVAIDISKHRHEVLIGIPGKKRRRFPAISFISLRISAQFGGRGRRIVLGSTPISRQARRCEIS